MDIHISVYSYTDIIDMRFLVVSCKLACLQGVQGLERPLAFLQALSLSPFLSFTRIEGAPSWETPDCWRHAWYYTRQTRLHLRPLCSLSLALDLAL